MREISKADFKETFIRHGGGYGPPGNPHCLKAWDEQYSGDGWRYLMEDPPSPAHTEMIVVSDFSRREYRMFFKTESGADDLFDYPGKE